MADKVVYEKRWDIYDEKKMISDANKSLTFLNFGNNTKNPQNATRLLERQLQDTNNTNNTNVTTPNYTLP